MTIYGVWLSWSRVLSLGATGRAIRMVSLALQSISIRGVLVTRAFMNKDPIDEASFTHMDLWSSEQLRV